MNTRLAGYLMAVLLGLATTPGLAVTLTHQCSAGNAINGISTADVTGNMGGSTDCFGTYTGNSPGPGGSLTFGSQVWDFVSKTEPGEMEGADIGLFYAGDTHGTWGYNPTYSFDSFMLVLKAANSPGWAAWLFDGDDAQSYSGDWSVAWEKDLSHLSLYASTREIPVPVSLPGSAGLLGLALLALGLVARRRR